MIHFLMMLNVQLDGLLPLSGDFSKEIPKPLFPIGARVSWHPSPNQDFGVITGVEYAPALHRKGWGWRYIVCLDAQSPSARWTFLDVAW